MPLEAEMDSLMYFVGSGWWAKRESLGGLGGLGK